MNNGLNLVTIAREILSIQENFSYNLKNPLKSHISDFEMETFTQVWCNTSDGFEGIGGSAMTEQRTYIFIPITCDEDCQVYFAGCFGYSVPLSEDFIKDVKNRKVAGCHHKVKYLNPK